MWKILFDLTIKHCDTSVDADFERLLTLKDGSILKLDLRDNVCAEPFYTGRYEFQTVNIAKEILQPIDKPVILDIGAHIGLFTIPLAKEIQSKNGMIHAFEPDKGNSQHLEINKNLNKLTNMIIYPYGLGNKSAEVNLGFSSKHTTENAKTRNAVILNDETGFKINIDRTTKVRIERLDDLYKEEKINKCSLVKLDVEGYELGVLKGGINFFREQKPVIIGEFNPYWLRYNGCSMEEIHALLKSLNYKAYKIMKNKLVAVQNTPKNVGNVVYM